MRASANEVLDKEQYVISCSDRKDGEQIYYGDSISLQNIQNMGWVGDGVTKLRVKMRAARPSEWFDLFDSSDLNARGPVRNGDTAILRNAKTDHAIAVTNEAGVLGHAQFEADGETGKVSVPVTATQHRLWLVCPSYGNKVCNAKGVCNSNRCECFAKWEGAACQRTRKFATCHSVGDPHWKSFDGLYFNVYSYGEYLQYYNPNSEAQEAVTSNLVKYVPNSIVAVNRGVALRRFKEIVAVTWPKGRVTVDCKDVTDEAKKGSYKTATGVVVKWIDSFWELASPSGLKVQAATYDWGQNLFFTIYEPEDGQQRGLCGNFDGNPGNDVGREAGFKAYDQPNDNFLATVFVPEANSLLNCAAGALGYSFVASSETVLRRAPPLRIVPAPAPSAAMLALQVNAKVGDPLDPASRARVEASLGHCKNERAEAQKACAGLLAEGKNGDGKTEYADCIEDQCETKGDTKFVAAAVQTVQTGEKVAAAVAEDRIAANAAEEKQEAANKDNKRVGAPDALDNKKK